MMTSELIADPAARKERAAAKRRAVLDFLASEIWTSAPILGQILDLPHRQPVNRLLLAMEKEGTIRRAVGPTLAGQGVTLWGITTLGRALVATADPLGPVFEPSRLALGAVPHNLALQALRLRAEAAGWTAWTRGEALGKDASVRPDAVATMPGGQRVAIECERTVKTAKRYQVVLAAHLRAIQARQWLGVYYVAPSNVAPALIRIFSAIPALPGGIIFDSTRRGRFKVVLDATFPSSSTSGE